VEQRVTLTSRSGESVRAIRGQRYYKSGGDANIRAESASLIIYENDRNEESEVSASYFVRKYTKEGYNSPFPRGS
jgi:hypothetical protein